MITKIRQGINSGFSRMLLWFMVISLPGATLLGLLINKFMGNDPQAAIIINGWSVGYRELQRNIFMKKQQISYIKQQFGEYAQPFLASLGLAGDPSDVALSEIIQQTLVQDASYKLYLDTLSDEYIKKEINDRNKNIFTEFIPAYVLTPQGNIDSKLLAQHLQRIGMTFADFEEEIRRTLRRINLLNVVRAGAYFPEFYTRAQYFSKNSSKQFGYVIFPLNKYKEEVLANELSDEVLKKYFSLHNTLSQRYFVPEKRSGKIWKFDPSRSNITITESEANSYYKRNKNNYIESPEERELRHIFISGDSDRDEKRARAYRIAKELSEKPNRFEEIAQQNSEDITTAQNGGLLGFVAYNNSPLDKKVTQEAFDLLNDGDISSVIETSKGFEIVQRVSIKPAQYKPFSLVEKTIKEKLTLEKFVKTFSSQSNQALSQNNLENFLATYPFTLEIIEEKSLNEVGKNTKKLFSIAKAGSRISYVENGQGYIIELTSIKEKHLPSFIAVIDKVREDLIYEKARELQQNNYQESLERTIALASWAKEKGLNYKTTTLLDPNSKDWDLLKQQGLPVNCMKNMFILDDTILGDSSKDIYSVELIDIKEKSDVTQDVQVTKNDVGFQKHVIAFIASLEKNATIKSNLNRPQYYSDLDTL